MAVILNELPSGYDPSIYVPGFDPLGVAIGNLIPGERFTIASGNSTSYTTIIPSYAPFYTEGAVFEKKNIDQSWSPLLLGEDYYYSYPFLSAQRATSKAVACGLTFTDSAFLGEVRLNYQTIGGTWITGQTHNASILTTDLGDPGAVAWEQVANYTGPFPEIVGPWDQTDPVTAQEALVGILALRQSVVDKAIELHQAVDSTHLANYENPHGITKTQVGLSLVRDISSATDVQALNDDENNKYINAAQVNSMILRKIPVATPVFPGVVRLNDGAARQDDIDSVKGLTAAAFRTQLNTPGSALRSAFQRGQIAVPVTPFPFTYPIQWNGDSYATEALFIAAVEMVSQIDPLEYSSSQGLFWFPPGTRAPELSIVSS